MIECRTYACKETYAPKASNAKATTLPTTLAKRGLPKGGQKRPTKRDPLKGTLRAFIEWRTCPAVPKEVAAVAHAHAQRAF